MDLLPNLFEINFSYFPEIISAPIYRLKIKVSGETILSNLEPVN